MAGAPQVQFTPSASATYPVPVIPLTIALPAVDSGNTAVVLRNLGPGTMAIMSGSISGQVFNAPGAITLQPGATLLATSPGLSNGTVACVQAQSGAQLTVMRGSIADIWLLPAPGVVII